MFLLNGPQLPGPSRVVCLQQGIGPSALGLVSQILHSHKTSLSGDVSSWWLFPSSLLSSSHPQSHQTSCPPCFMQPSAFWTVPTVQFSPNLEFSFLYLQNRNGILQNELTNSCPVSFLARSRKEQSWLPSFLLEGLQGRYHSSENYNPNLWALIAWKKKKTWETKCYF